MSAYFITRCNCDLTQATPCCSTDPEVYVRREDLPTETVYFTVNVNTESKGVYSIGPNAPTVLCFDPNAFQVRPPSENGQDEDGNPLTCPADPCVPYEPGEFGGDDGVGVPPPPPRRIRGDCFSSSQLLEAFFRIQEGENAGEFIDFNFGDERIKLIELNYCPGSPTTPRLFVRAGFRDEDSDATAQERMDSIRSYSFGNQCAYYELQSGPTFTLDEIDFENDRVLDGGRRYIDFQEPDNDSSPRTYDCEPCSLAYPTTLCPGYDWDNYYEAESVEDFFVGGDSVGKESVWIRAGESPEAGKIFRVSGRLFRVLAGQRTPTRQVVNVHSVGGIAGAVLDNATLYDSVEQYETNQLAIENPGDHPDVVTVEHVDADRFIVPPPPPELFVRWGAVFEVFFENDVRAFENSQLGPGEEPEELIDVDGDKLLVHAGYCYTFNYNSTPVPRPREVIAQPEPGEPVIRRNEILCRVGFCNTENEGCGEDNCEGYRLSLCPGQNASTTFVQYAITKRDFDEVYEGPFRVAGQCFHVEEPANQITLTPEFTVVGVTCPYEDCEDCVCGEDGVLNCASSSGVPWVPCTSAGTAQLYWSSTASVLCFDDILFRVIDGACYHLTPSDPPLPVPPLGIVIPPVDTFDDCDECEESLDPDPDPTPNPDNGGGDPEPPIPPPLPPGPGTPDPPPERRTRFDIYHPCGTMNTSRGGRRGRNGPATAIFGGTCYERTGSGETSEGAFIRDMSRVEPCVCDDVFVQFNGCNAGGFSARATDITGSIPGEGTVVQFEGNDVCFEVGEVFTANTEPGNYNGTPRTISGTFPDCNTCDPCSSTNWGYHPDHPLYPNRCCWSEGSRIVDYESIENTYRIVTENGLRVGVRLESEQIITQDGESTDVSSITRLPVTIAFREFNSAGIIIDEFSDSGVEQEARFNRGTTGSLWGRYREDQIGLSFTFTQNDCCGLDVQVHGTSRLEGDNLTEPFLISSESFRVIGGTGCCYDPDVAECVTNRMSDCEGSLCPSGDMP